MTLGALGAGTGCEEERVGVVMGWSLEWVRNDGGGA